MSDPNRYRLERGRGAVSNPPSRFDTIASEAVDDGWGVLDEPLPPLHTIVQPIASRTIITRNQSPDVGFEQSINPYLGCEHGCIYCYARPSHGYLSLSPGLDFETRLFYKPDAARLLERELSAPNYRCRVIALGVNTDAYQPIEREYQLTRQILEVLARFRHPVCLITKSSLIERDIDILSDLAKQGLALATLSITTLDANLKRTLEPRTASPAARLRTVRRLADAGIPVGVMMAPVIPALNDHELESILEAAADAGASSAGYVLLRLPHELKTLFEQWLQTHAPLKAQHVMSRLRAMRAGQQNDPRFGHRMRGEGVFADLLQQRFTQAVHRFGLDRRDSPLRCDLFAPSRNDIGQLSLNF